MVIRTYPQGLADGAPVDHRVRCRPRAVGCRRWCWRRAREPGCARPGPKPLHRLCGRPMVLHVLDALAELSVARVVVVVGHRAEWVTKTLIEHAPPGMAIEFVEQVEQRGTGDAMAVALTGLPDEEGDDDGDVVVLPGDTPLLRPATLAALVHHAPGLGQRGHAADRRARRSHRLRPGGPGPGRLGGPGGRARRRIRRGARGPRDQHLHLLLPAERAGSVAPPAEPGQRPGRALPDRRGRRALRGRVTRWDRWWSATPWRWPGSTTGPSWPWPRPSCGTGSTSGGCAGGSPCGTRSGPISTSMSRSSPTWCMLPGVILQGVVRHRRPRRAGPERPPGRHRGGRGGRRWPPASAGARSSVPTPGSGRSPSSRRGPRCRRGGGRPLVRAAAQRASDGSDGSG